MASAPTEFCRHRVGSVRRVTLITSRMPGDWVELEDAVASILQECGMRVRQHERLKLLRGHFDADVVADETVEGISNNIICECKFWSTNIPAEKVRSFRVAVDETGANRGYVISRNGFQSGAVEAARATNVELVTYERFQELYFEKWFRTRIWSVENAIKGFHSYYEPGPFCRPGYAQLESDDERAEYNAAWNQYFFAGALLVEFSPYVRMHPGTQAPPPPLPLDVTKIEQAGFAIPDDIKFETGYREVLAALENYAQQAISDLRTVNPITRGKPNAD
ncbi:hypothetical protein MSIM_43440 [Mycobacterium simiae]|nr:hypothetical protein MSIM_43440 [Mycobacterium simiae]